MKETKRKLGRPFLPKGERKVWKSMRLRPQAAKKLAEIVKTEDKSAGEIVSHLLEEAQAPYGVSH